MGGAILVGIIETGLFMMLLGPKPTMFFTGFLVLIAILINHFTSQLKDRMLSPE